MVPVARCGSWKLWACVLAAWLLLGAYAFAQPMIGDWPTYDEIQFDFPGPSGPESVVLLWNGSAWFTEEWYSTSGGWGGTMFSEDAWETATVTIAGMDGAALGHSFAGTFTDDGVFSFISGSGDYGDGVEGTLSSGGSAWGSLGGASVPEPGTILSYGFFLFGLLQRWRK